MTDHVGQLDDGDTGFELFDDKGVPEIVDFGSFDPGDTEVAVDGGPDVPNQEGVAGFGDKEGGVLGAWPIFNVDLDCLFGGFVERNLPGVVTFEGSNFEAGLLQSNVLELDPGQFTDPEACLEQDFDYGIHPDVVFGGVAKSTVLKGGEDTGRGDLVLGVAHAASGRGSNYSFAD